MLNLQVREIGSALSDPDVPVVAPSESSPEHGSLLGTSIDLLDELAVVQALDQS